MTKFINKKISEKPRDERTIFFTKDKPENSQNDTSEDFKKEFAENFDDLVPHTMEKSEQSRGNDSKEFAEMSQDERIKSLRQMIDSEKNELDAITNLMITQTKHVQNARKILGEKQLLLQTELSKKTSKFSTNDKLSLIGDMSAKMAHDVRTPLTVLKNQVDLMKLQFSKNENAIMLDSVNRMDRAISIITNQFDDILHFLREEPMYDLKEYSLQEILKDSLFGMKIPPNVNIVMSQNDSIVSCDKNKLERVFANMIQNSIHALESGGAISLKISERVDHVTIAIIDSGPGIAEENMDRIFDPLFTTKKHGTGLGLTICRQIIQDHDGNITVENNPTTFTITLPKKHK